MFITINFVELKDISFIQGGTNIMRKYSYLLTYSKDGQELYRWFLSEQEMDNFIDSDSSIEVNEGIHIKEAETVRGFKLRRPVTNWY